MVSYFPAPPEVESTFKHRMKYKPEADMSTGRVFLQTSDADEGKLLAAGCVMLGLMAV